MMGIVSTVCLELVFYIDIKQSTSVGAPYMMMQPYPVLPGLGPSTVIVVDTFDLQGGNRKGFAPKNG